MDRGSPSTAVRRIGRFAPGLAALLSYDRADLRHDVVAGVSVAAVALPVGVAYAQLAGFPAVHGLYASILPLVAYAAFGTSRQLIVGPDAATCALVAASVAPLDGGDPERYLSYSVMLALLAVLGDVPAGLPRLAFPSVPVEHLPPLLGAAAGLALVTFTSMMLTARSFASKNGYEIDTDREFAALGAANIAAAFSQSFAVSGADSRTAVSEAAGGRTQATGLVAAATLGVVLLFRFNGPVVFFNAPHFKRELLAAVEAQGPGLKRVVFDMVPIPLVDVTGLYALREVVVALGGRGVRLSSAGRMAEWADRAKRWGFDTAAWGVLAFPTLEAAVEAFASSAEAGTVTEG